MEWVLGDVIGEGGCASVRFARPKKQNPQVPQVIAVKSSSFPDAELLLHEYSILEELKDCPHIIHCFDYHTKKMNGEKTCSLFLEYADGGSLQDKLKKQINGRFEESEVKRYTKAILEGVDYIHKKGYVHRDLKPANILLCSSSKGGNDILKITDFGIAKRCGESNERKQSQVAGTAHYCSPEAVNKKEQETPSDVWAIGCIVLEMLTGAPPWQYRRGEGEVTIMTRILLEETPKIPEYLSPESKDFLRKSFIKDPAKRWTARQLLDHPFVADIPSLPRGPLSWCNRYESSESSSSTTKVTTKKSSKRISFVKKFPRFLLCQGGDWSASERWTIAR